MLHPHLVLACALVTAACGKVDHPSDGAPGDDRDDGGGTVIIDAGAPDATPVACDGPEDCMNPDDPCLLAGPCEESVCHFAAMDCSEFDDECTAGICQDGACEPKAVREDQACGGGIMDCGGFGACGGYADTCDESGTQSRSCTDSTCQAGECVTGAAYSDSRACSRDGTADDTDGDTCATTETTCGQCSFGSCSTSGSRSCTRTEFSCSNGSCASSTESFSDSCSRPQPECCGSLVCNGATCGPQLCP